MHPEERADDIVHDLDEQVRDLERDGCLEQRNAGVGVRLVCADGPQEDSEA